MGDFYFYNSLTVLLHDMLIKVMGSLLSLPYLNINIVKCQKVWTQKKAVKKSH